MKNSTKRFAQLMLCVFIILLGSCSQNPIDKKIDEMEALYIKMNKMAHEANPSDEELIRLKSDANKFESSMQIWVANNPELDNQATAIQKKRMLDILMKKSRLESDPAFLRLWERLRTIDSNH